MKKITTLLLPIFLMAASSDISNYQTSTLVEFTDANFKKLALDKKGVTIVEFWATWCGPCKIVEPIITELAEDYGKKISIGKLNVDLEPKTTMEYGISSIPTILIFKDGEVVDKYVGVLSKKDLEDKIDVLL